MRLLPRRSPLSETAAAVAIAQHLHGAPVGPAARRWLADAGARPRWLLRATAVPGLRAAVRAIGRAAVQRAFPGLGAHLAHRRRWFAQRTAAFLAAGGRQIVTLGGGFDDRAFTWIERDGAITAIDFDRAAMAAHKQARAAHPRVQWRPTDLASEPIDAALRAAGARASAPTLVLAEGVLMYLDEASVERQLRALATFARGPWQLAASFLTTAATGGPLARIHRHLEGSREPFRWAKSPDELAPWLAAACGWTPITTQELDGESLLAATPSRAARHDRAELRARPDAP